MKQSDLKDVLGYFREAEKDSQFLVVCKTGPKDSPDLDLPAGSSCTWRSGIESVDEVPDSDRADLGVVFNQIEFMQKPAAVHLLSRLRDRHCTRVVLCMTSPIFSERELLALGYIEQNRPSTDGRFFLFDPAVFFERREWNSPDGWANPQNFNRERW